MALPLQAEETASLESLTRTYESGGETERIFALFRAGRLSGRAGETLVQRALDDPHPAVRSRAVLEWLRLRGAAGLNLFRTPLHDQNPRVRRTFLTAARTHVGDAAVPYLLDALADPIPTVRTTAIRELRRLAGGLQHGFDPTEDPAASRSARARWRQWWADHRDLPTWRRWARASRNPDARNRARAATQLAHAPGHQVVPDLLRLLADSSPQVRSRAIQSLRNLTLARADYDPDSDLAARLKGIERWHTWWAGHAQQTLRFWMTEALTSPGPRERGRAAHTLGLNGDPEVIPHLLPMLSDPKSRVRERAQQALIRLTGKDHDYDPDGSLLEREEAIQKWKMWWNHARYRSPRDWAHESFARGVPRERVRALRHLAATHHLEEFPWIAQGLRDPAGGVREEAARALRSLAGTDFGYDPDVKGTDRDRAIHRALTWWRRHE